MKKERFRKACKGLLVLSLLAFACRFEKTADAAASPFEDISNSYAQNQIQDLYQRNVVGGTADRIFEPEKPVTRAELIAMLDRALNMQPVSSAIPAFADVSPGSWYYGWVQAGVELGLIEGTSPNRFEPDQPVTRQEAAALVVRALKQKAMNDNAASLPFRDSGLVSSWAVPYVEAAGRLGLMVGDAGAFRPLQPITRQETAVVIDKLFTDSRWSGAWSASSSASSIQLGWQYDSSTAEYEQEITNSTINTLSPRWYFLGDNLTADDNTDTSLIAWANQNKKNIWAMVGNHSDQSLTHQLLSQSDKMEAFIQQLSGYAQKYGLAGLNIDFENVASSDRDLYTSFIAKLAKELHAHNKTLSVDVSPDTGADWTEAFDYAAMGESADYIVLMAYDEHWDGDQSAGSVSSLPWVTDGIGNLKSHVPVQKIIVALPLYTRDWTSENGATASRDLSLREQNGLVDSNALSPVWDSKLGQYKSSYTSAAQVHTVWLEDSRSLSLKYQAVASGGVAGTAYWYVGGESPDIWDSLRNMMKYSSYSFGS